MATRHPSIQRYLLPSEQAEREKEKIEMSREYPHFTKMQIDEAIKLFNQSDKNKNGSIDKHEFTDMMQRLVPDSLSDNPNFQHSMQLYFEALDRDHSNSISKKEFLELYNDLFISERSQVALLLTTTFPGTTVQQLARVLEEIEKLEVNGVPLLDKDELYQLKEEITPDLADQLKQIDLARFLAKDPPDYQAIGQAYLKQHGDPSPSGLLGNLTGQVHSVAGQVQSGLDQVTSRLQELVTTDRFLGGLFSKWGAASTSSDQIQVASRDLGAATAAGPAGAGASSGDAGKAFDEFKNAMELKDIVASFERLKAACGVTNSDFKATYKKIKDKVAPKVTNSRVFWALIDKRLAQAEYKNPPSPPAKVVVVGSGPGGLRAAFEACFLGNEVTILEKRDVYSRNNLLHIWDATIRDLKNIGAKYFYSRFCLGGVNHIPIRALQGLLLKLNLLVGAHFHYNVSFETAKKQSSAVKPASGRPAYWRVELAASAEAAKVPAEDLLAHALVGADGENSLVAKFGGFQKKVLQGSRAIGITANFVNTKTTAENTLKELSILSVYHQDFFNTLSSQHGIDLENLVYYRDETHYFVMTAKTDSLVGKGVCKTKHPNVDQLLARENKDMAKLEAFVREVADYVKLPASCQFAKTPSGANDVAIFDFSKKQQSVTAVQYVGDGANPLPVVLAGDALVEPFWPLGTGANRAVMAALDAAWLLKRSFGADQKATQQQITKEAAAAYRVLMTSTPDDLVSNFGLHAIEPSTRYRAVSKFGR